jgi:PE family protein
MLFVDTPLVAAQGATEAAGAATTGATLAGGAPAMAAMIPMGGEEVSALFAAAIAAHASQYLAATGVGVVQRGLFAASSATSSAAYAVTDATAATQLAM